MAFNRNLKWLAETLGVPVKRFAHDGHLAGAIFSRIADLVKNFVDRLEQGEEFRCCEEYTIGDITIKKGDIVTFERVDNYDQEKPWAVIVSLEEGQELQLEIWKFIEKFRIES